MVPPMNSVAFCPTLGAVSSPPQQETAVKRISSGDANARFRSVVLPHLDDAYRLARWLTGSRSDSEDVVQDACLRALRGIGNFSHGNARLGLDHRAPYGLQLAAQEPTGRCCT